MCTLMILNMVDKSSFLTLTMYYNQLDWEVFILLPLFLETILPTWQNYIKHFFMNGLETFMICIIKEKAWILTQSVWASDWLKKVYVLITCASSPNCASSLFSTLNLNQVEKVSHLIFHAITKIIPNQWRFLSNHSI